MSKVLFITHFFPPAIGGAERYAENLVPNLAPSNLIVVVPPTAGDTAFDQTLSCRVIRKNLLKPTLIRPSWLSHLPWLLSLVRTEHVSRVVFGHYAGFVTLGLLSKLILGVPYTVSVFGLDFYAYRKSLVRRILLRWNLRSAEWIVTISSFTRSVLKAFGVPEGKIALAPPGIDTPEPPTPDDISRFMETHHLRDNHVLLTVARLVKRKGQARVIQALPAILQKFPQTTYVIVGSGPELRVLERLGRELGVSEHMQLLGRCSNKDVQIAYHAADIFIMVPSASSSDVEGFGIVYIEALAAAKPIVATTSGGVVDILRHNENGIALNEGATALDIAHAVVNLLSNPEKIKRLGENGRAFVRTHFSIRRQVEPFLRILEPPPSAPTSPPRVSVIIPVWNSTDTLPKTLNSVSVQTYKNTEVIVVDDGSHDDPAPLCSRFPNVRLIRQEHAGAATARNRGFKESGGMYVLFCDADVILHPRMIERMVTTLELKPEASYAYCSFRFGWRTFDLFDFNPERLQHHNYISMMSLIRREAFPGFDESLPRLQDWDLWLTMLEQGRTGVWVPARLFSASVGKRGISEKIKQPPLEMVQRIREKHRLV